MNGRHQEGRTSSCGRVSDSGLEPGAVLLGEAWARLGAAGAAARWSLPPLEKASGIDHVVPRDAPETPTWVNTHDADSLCQNSRLLGMTVCHCQFALAPCSIGESPCPFGVLGRPSFANLG